MTFSVIVPSYNSEAFIASCIESILAQTMPDFECIIVNDGSTDGTLKECERLAERDGRIRVESQSRKGPGAARNRGIELARGEFIQYVDSDDLLKPSALEEELAFIRENSLQMAVIDGEGQRVTIDPFKQLQISRRLESKEDYGISSGKEMFCRMVRNENFSSYSFLQIARRDAVKCRFSDFVIDEDFAYSVKSFISAEKAGHLRKPLYVKRGWRTSILASPLTARNGIASLAHAIEEVESWAEMNGEEIGEELAACIQMLLDSRLKELRHRMKLVPPMERVKLAAMDEKCRKILHRAMEAGNAFNPARTIFPERRRLQN